MKDGSCWYIVNLFLIKVWFVIICHTCVLKFRTSFSFLCTIIRHYLSKVSFLSLTKIAQITVLPVRYKHFERWAMGADFPLANIINNGSSLPDTQRGALADLQLVLDTKRLAAGAEDVMVVAGDMMFQVR